MPPIGRESDSAATLPMVAPPERGLFEVRPSPWYVVLEAWPTCAVLTVVALATATLGYFTGWLVGSASLSFTHMCGAVMVLRFLLEGGQWARTVYWLTDRRASGQSGLLSPDTAQVLLTELEDVELVRGWGQRLTGTGSLHFHIEGLKLPVMVWEHLSEPDEVREAVLAAAARAKRRGSSES